MKEYISKLINENNEELQNLQNRISYLLVELEKQNKIIEKMQRYTGRDENIFSPRTANVINEEQVKREKDKGDSINQEIKYASEKMERLFAKQNEYAKVLDEIESKKIESVNSMMCMNVEEVSEQKNIKEDMSDNELENLDEEEKINTTNYEKEITSAEKLIEISKSIDIALALLNGDKNKCKNELKKIKRELKKYIEEIK